MANSNLLDTKTVTLGDLLGNGKKYVVPVFQRDYSWDESNWEDLWNDLISVIENDEKHYMGAIVLQRRDDNEYFVIDGQQRLTTISLLSLSIISNLRKLVKMGIDENKNKERIDELTKRFINQKDPASLLLFSKLTLNERNNGFYQHNLVNFTPPNFPKKLNESEKALWDGFLFFEEAVRTYFGDYVTGEKLANFLNKSIADKLLFIQITVEDELNAYTVFETLNARGVDLSPTDLLKNYLFSLSSGVKSEFDIIKQIWNTIVNKVSLERFPTFLRHYLNSKQQLVPRQSLFKALKKAVKSKSDVLELLKRLDYFSTVYIALESPEDEIWTGEKEIPNYIREIELFKVVLIKPLLMASFEKLTIDEFRKVLRDLTKLIFRYNVIGKNNPNEMETVINKAAIKVTEGSLKFAKDIFEQGLKHIYVDDDLFRTEFAARRFNTSGSPRKIVRYILYQLEAQYEGGAFFDHDKDSGTIEHILPESYTPNWGDKFKEDEHNRWVYALGNLTLLEPSKNRKDAGQKIFDEKKIVFSGSKYAMTRDIVMTEWTPTMIRHRQEKMAKIAAGIWRISY